MRSKRVAVVRGGPSEEYAVSMATGQAVLESLGRLRYPTKDIIITKSGEWLDNGMVRSPQAALGAVDIVFIALHGAYGEDGAIQKVLRRLVIPFTGSGSFASSVAFNKDLTKKQLRAVGVRMPPHMKLTRDGVSDPLLIAQTIIGMFGPAYVIKPVASGSSLGTRIVRTPSELAIAITNALTEQPAIMVEEMVVGKEATVGVLEGFRGGRLYQFPPIEIIPPEHNEFFDYECKYNGTTTELCPGRFTDTEKQLLLEMTCLVHEQLGLTQYSRSDFIIKDGEPYFLEVNTLPGLTTESLFPKAVAAVGGRYEDLIEHLVETAIAN